MENEYFEQRKEQDQADEIKLQNPDLFELPKSKLPDFDFNKEITSLVNRVLEGNDNALDSYKLLISIKKKAELARLLILDEAITEAEKYEIGQLTKMGCEFTAGATYEYNNSPEWIDATAKVTEIQEQMKANITSNSLTFSDGHYFDENGDEVFLANKNLSKKSLKFTKLKLKS